MEIFVDQPGRQLLVDASSVTPLGTLRLGENIIEPISIWLLDRGENSGAALTPAALPAGFTNLVIAGRPLVDLEDDELLFSLTEFTAVGAGETLHYEGLLTLGTTELRAALAGLKRLDVLVDIDFVNADLTRKTRLIMHAPAIALRDIFRGTEGAPESGSPEYPLGSAIVTVDPDGANEKHGSTGIGTGVEYLDVVFATPFTGDAAPDVFTGLVISGAGDERIFPTVLYNVTPTGFRQYLSAATTLGTHRLSWRALRNP